MILLDTCVVSEAMQAQPAPAVLSWIASLHEADVWLPSPVVGELRSGISRLDDGAKRAALELWFEQLGARFAGRILAFDEHTALAWGTLTARLSREGRRLPVMDGLIAALTLQHAAVLATRNVADFRAAGVETVDPWASV